MESEGQECFAKPNSRWFAKKVSAGVAPLSDRLKISVQIRCQFFEFCPSYPCWRCAGLCKCSPTRWKWAFRVHFGRSKCHSEWKKVLPSFNVKLSLTLSQQASLQALWAKCAQSFYSKIRLIGSLKGAEPTVNTGDAVSISHAPYHRFSAERVVIQKAVTSLLDLGAVSSSSPRASPVVSSQNVGRFNAYLFRLQKVEFSQGKGRIPCISSRQCAT